MSVLIDGVEIKKLTTYSDNRGFFREIIRNSDNPFFECGFGQFSHSFMFPGVIKAWHYHKIQTDYFYVANGTVRVGVYDMRETSKTYRMTMDFLMGDYQDAQCLKVPPGVLHGVKAVVGPANLLYIMSHEYNPKDEYRLAYNDPSIPFNWLEDYKIT